ncbi:MAG TPA: GEVED domain-containing protein, partial [Thiolinea sp.]|nr:GEVED domain-containing protein [Thiolinea sp.]
IAVGDLQATDTSNADATRATLTVIQHPTITKSFLPAAILTGENSTLRFRLSNPNPSILLPSGLTEIHFTDTLTDMQIATPMVVSSGCANFAYQATPGGTTFEVTDASLPAGASCNIDLRVTSSVLGAHDNQSSGVTTAQTTTASPPSNIATLSVDELNITGVVFEDVNYGGGAGRDQAGSGGAGVNGVTVELYDAAGYWLASTLTANDGTRDGAYDFAAVTDGDYYVRVVNQTVASTRPGSDGSERGVQTFRSDGTTPVTDEVGGRNPAVADTLAYAPGALLNTGNFTFTGGMIDGQAQSVTPVTVAGSDVTGVDFGFNFDTIVNVNDAGQGSLRQFILNSNRLANTGLAQEGSRKALDNTDEALPAGVETSIFMIPAAQLTGGVAQITLNSSTLPAITGANGAGTLIDATTQTVNIGDTNPGVLGSGGTVGVDALPLPQIQRPEVQLAPAAAGMSYGLTVGAGNSGVRGLAIYGFGTNVNANGLIIVNSTGTNALIEQNLIGTSATSFSAPPLQGPGSSVNISGSSGILRNNLIGFSRGNGVRVTSTLWSITGNEIHANGNGSADNLWSYFGSLLTIEGNRIADAASGGFDGLNASTFTNNTVTGNGQATTSSEDYGVSVVGNGSVLSKNIFSGNVGQGILVYSNVQPASINNIISQNLTFNNGKLAIDITASSSTAGNDVTLNDAGDTDTGPNNGLNFPQFSSAALLGTDMILQGCAPAGSTIELFEADVSPTAASGVSAGANRFGRTQDYGEGERYLLTLTEGVDEDTATTPPDCSTLTDADGNSALGMNPFRWTVPLPADVVAGDLLTATATLSATGTSEFSAVIPLTLLHDYGDAPASYGAPSHTIVSGIHLGLNAPDAESASVSPLDGSGDDATDTDDEDGAFYGTVASGVALDGQPFYRNRLQTVEVAVTGTGARLSAWFDWNGDGDFLDAGEQVAADSGDDGTGSDLLAGDGIIQLLVTPPAGVVAGTGYARFRWSTDSGLTPDGTAADGEVEDYAVTLVDATPFTCDSRLFSVANSPSILREADFSTLPASLNDLGTAPQSLNGA